MQFKTFTLSTLLLALPEAAFATQGVAQYRKALEISGKNSFSLDFQPQYFQPQYFADPVEGKSLAKRETCVGGSTPCWEGCCESFHLCYWCCAFSVEVLTTVPGRAGTVCGKYGGVKGCCPVGKTCNGVDGCPDPSYVYCTTYCCKPGTTCSGLDKNGEGLCRSTDECDAGYSLCTEFEGCCPNGVRCVPPKNCAVSCSADDPKCGSGCCEKGYYCNKDGMCSKYSTTLEGPPTTYTRTILPKIVSSSETLVDTTTTPDSTTTTSTTDSTTTTSTTTIDSTTKSSTTSTHPPFRSSSSSASDYTTPAQVITTSRITVSPQTSPHATGAAPTMGAMLGGLGMAAGILGVFAM